MVAAEQQPYASLRDGETVVRELSKEFDIELIIVPEKELEDLGLEIPANYNTSDIKFNKKQITIIRELIQKEKRETEYAKSLLPMDVEWLKPLEIHPLVYVESERPWQPGQEGYPGSGRSIVRGDLDPATGIIHTVYELDYWVPAALGTYNFIPTQMSWSPDAVNKRVVVNATGDIYLYVPGIPPIVLEYQGAQRVAYHGRVQ